jgi:hypothetical protein
MLALYAPWGALGAGAAAAAWALTRERARPLVAAHRGKLAAAAALAVVALLGLPSVRGALHAAWAIGVDLATVAPRMVAPSVPRTPGGGIVYAGGLKHALLQSLPWLPLVVVLLLRPRREDAGRGGALGLLALVPAASLAESAAWGYDGGLCLNLRLLVPALPFLATLGAWAAHVLARRWGRGPGPAAWAAATIAAAAAFGALSQGPEASAEALEASDLHAPLLLAAALLALLVAGEALRPGPGRDLARRGTWAVLAAAVAWAGLVALLHDYPRHRARRAGNWAAGAAALEGVPAGSLVLLSDFPDPLMRLLDAHDVVLAFPYEDECRDLPRLILRAAHAGRRVFGAFPPDEWRALGEGPLRGLDAVPAVDLGPAGVLVELRVASPAAR